MAHGTFSDIVGGYTDGGHNIVQDGAGITQPTSKSGDPRIGPLANNGGTTLTHALLPGSPAIDAGDCNAATPESDQRGVSRPLGNACDIGAYESEYMPSSTTTELTSSLNPSIIGQPVTFTATVAATPPATATPVGTVTFQDGATTLATVALDGSGVAMVSSTALPCGDHSITATYDGDAGFTVSTSEALIQTVNRLSTTTVLTSSPNPTIVGQPVTLTATVAAIPPATGVPTGTVQFVIDDASLGDPVTVLSGSAIISSDALPEGVHTVSASYGGDGDFAPSTAGMELAVSDAAPQTRPIPWCGFGIVETVALSLVGLTAVSLRRRISPRAPV